MYNPAENALGRKERRKKKLPNLKSAANDHSNALLSLESDFKSQFGGRIVWAMLETPKLQKHCKQMGFACCRRLWTSPNLRSIVEIVVLVVSDASGAS